MTVTWSRSNRKQPGYEVSSVGDKRFSALTAIMPDGRTIEMWYQCDIKGYDPMGRNWRLGKGKPSRYAYPEDHLYEMYLALWRIWAIHHQAALADLKLKAQENGNNLCDCFASTPINQARALAQILNEWC